MITEILTAKQIRQAVELVKEGKLVAFPTETVYGLGAPLFAEEMVMKIFKIKGRPFDNPLIAHVVSLEQCEQIADGLSPLFYQLAEAFFPGPLTLVIKKNPSVPNCVSAGLDTIAVRMPKHPIARDFISALNTPVVAPSANISGRPSSTTVAHVLEDFNGKIAAVIDGGSCDYGIESTVLDIVSFETPTLLRPGAITKEDLENVLKIPIAMYTKGPKGSPGMKYRHYAPKAKVKFFEDEQDLETYFLQHKNALVFSTKPLKQKSLLLTSKNYEKYIDRLGFCIELADKSLTVFAVGLQGTVLAESIGRTYFDVSGSQFIWQCLPTVVHVLTIPLSAVFIAFAFVQGVCESIHLKRTAQLLINLQKQAPNLQNQLLWLENEYFALTPEEVKLIQAYIDWKDENCSLEQKGVHFETVADKLLKIKYSALQRRITPWLAEEVKQTLPKILHDLIHGDESKKASAIAQAKELVQNINTQGKKQIFLYALCLFALAVSVAGLICAIVFSCGIPVLVLTGAAALLMFTRLILARGMLPERGWNFSFDNVLPFHQKKRPAAAHSL